MESFIIYLAKASAIIAMFFVAYHLLLRKETFFNSNRWFLLAGLLTAAVLPLLAYTKVIWITAPKATAQQIDVYAILNAIPQHRQDDAAIHINWYDVLGGMYLTGVLLFLVRFVLDLRAVGKILKNSVAQKSGAFRLIDSSSVSSPFSFFGYIVYNSALLEPRELRDILAHEKVHSSQWHSLDMIISQLFCVAFWFNPFTWMYKKSVSQNLEFIADAGAIQYLDDRIAYQKTLLKITMQPECISITNHFYQSLIKKRIVMLNTQRSRRRNSWKYTIVLPALVAFMLLFQVKTVAQEKQAATTVTEKVKIAVEVTKDSKDDELEANKKLLKEEFDTDVTFSNITRNGKSEITAIKVAVKDKAQSKVYEVAGTEPISPFTIEIEQNANKGTNHIAFGSTASRGKVLKSMVYRKMDSIAGPQTGYVEDIEDNRATPVPPAPPVPPVHGMAVPAPMPGHWAVNRLTIDNKDMLIVVDGVKQKPGAPVQIALDRELDKLTMLKEREGKKKYGREGKRGVVEITTKRADAAARFSRSGAIRMRHPEMNADDEAFRFEFDMDDMGDDIVHIFSGDGADVFRMLPEGFMDEEMKAAEEQLKSAHMQIQRMKPRVRAEMSRERAESLEEARKEIEEARKEIEKSRKELEEARKVIQAKSKEMSRKA